MRRLALLVFLPMLLAAKKPWPQKGDVAFIPAEVTITLPTYALSHLNIPYSRLDCPSTQICTYSHPACLGVSVEQTKKNGDVYVRLVAGGPGVVILGGRGITRSRIECQKSDLLISREVALGKIELLAKQ